MDVKKYFDDHYSEDIKAMSDWADEIYKGVCGDSFSRVLEISAKMDSEKRPITDEELEWVLTVLPLNLFQISEALNKLRMKSEYTKLVNKKQKSSTKPAKEKPAEVGYEDEASSDQVVGALVTEVFNSVIKRVENEISFSRELIMGSKKIWDSRRSSESSNPVGPVVPGEGLPDYGRPTNYTGSIK